MLNASRIETLFASTEGWAAALRISMSVLSRKECQPAQERMAPSGTARPFAAYIEHIFERLPAEMVEFMLRTSILDRLSASLCEAITGLRTSQRMLDEIAEGQLLLQPLDCDGQWFRYHHLMGEYLRAKLEAQHVDEVAELHCRACDWYSSQALWTEAVKHAIAAGTTDTAIRLMERCAMALVKKGDLLTLLGLQRRFPAVLAGAQVKVTLAIAGGMALAMHFDEALAMLDAVERTRVIEVFREVLKVAAPAGVYQSILDVGPDIGSLLHAVCEDAQHAAQTNELIPYINHLLDGWWMLYQPGGNRQRDTERGSLSSRAREIVDLIARGQSNKGIANTLGIGAETVKSHVKSIFMKPGVDTRAQAVARARDLGLVGQYQAACRGYGSASGMVVSPDRDRQRFEQIPPITARCTSIIPEHARTKQPQSLMSRRVSGFPRNLPEECLVWGPDSNTHPTPIFQWASD